MHNHQRIESLDVFRGFAMILIILFHSAIYNFANIHLLDFSNPPIVVVLMSFMGLWGGVFIIYSPLVNAVSVLNKSRERLNTGHIKYLLIAGGVYLIAHLLLNFFFGRWSIDFVNNQPDLTLTARILRDGGFSFPSAGKWFEGSSLSTIALNLMITAFVLLMLVSNDGLKRTFRNYFILGVSATAIMLLSFFRVDIYHALNQAIDSGNNLRAVLLSFLLANPYPLLPYLAYGLFGLMAGMMIYQRQYHLIKRIILPIASGLLLFGLYGMTKFDKTISKPDFFWYFKTHFELGLFLLLFVVFSRFPKPGNILLTLLSPLKWFSRVSLTIYLMETTVSEVIRMISMKFLPFWNQTINGCLWFGAANILFWMIILFFWRKVDFRYSLEYFWIKLFHRLGKNSTKLEFN